MLFFYFWTFKSTIRFVLNILNLLLENNTSIIDVKRQKCYFNRQKIFLNVLQVSKNNVGCLNNFKTIVKYQKNIKICIDVKRADDIYKNCALNVKTQYNLNKRLEILYFWTVVDNSKIFPRSGENDENMTTSLLIKKYKKHVSVVFI